MFRIVLPCTGKVNAEVDVNVYINITTPSSGQNITALTLRRKKICLKDAVTAPPPTVAPPKPENTMTQPDDEDDLMDAIYQPWFIAIALLTIFFVASLVVLCVLTRHVSARKKPSTPVAYASQHLPAYPGGDRQPLGLDGLTIIEHQDWKSSRQQMHGYPNHEYQEIGHVADSYSMPNDHMPSSHSPRPSGHNVYNTIGVQDSQPLMVDASEEFFHHRSSAERIKTSDSDGRKSATSSGKQFDRKSKSRQSDHLSAESKQSTVVPIGGHRYAIHDYQMIGGGGVGGGMSTLERSVPIAIDSPKMLHLYHQDSSSSQPLMVDAGSDDYYHRHAKMNGDVMDDYLPSRKALSSKKARRQRRQRVLLAQSKTAASSTSSYTGSAGSVGDGTGSYHRAAAGFNLCVSSEPCII